MRHVAFASLVALALSLLASAVGHAQGAGTPLTTATPAAPERSIEDLNLVGAAVTMPSFSDSLLGVDSGFRRALFSQGMLLRANIVPRYSHNLLDEAVVLPDLNVPGFNFHKLLGRPVRYSLHVNGPWCVRFEWEDGEAVRVNLEQYH